MTEEEIRRAFRVLRFEAMLGKSVRSTSDGEETIEALARLLLVDLDRLLASLDASTRADDCDLDNAGISPAKHRDAVWSVQMARDRLAAELDRC